MTSEAARDPLRLRAAYTTVLPVANALPKGERDHLNANPAEAATLCIQAGMAVKSAPMADDFAKLSADFFDHDAVAHLETYGLALSFVTNHLQDALAIDSVRRLPEELAKESAETRDRLLRLIEYRLGHDPEIAAKLVDIKSGQGYHDRASDLTRLAGIAEAHDANLSKDDIHYRPTDRADALHQAARIHEEIQRAGVSAADEVKDLRAAIWTLASRAYAEVRRGAQFMEKSRPGIMASFPPLNAYGTSKPAPAEAPLAEAVA